PVLDWRQAGQVSGLRGAGERGKCRDDRNLLSFGGKPVQCRGRRAEKRFCEADDIDDRRSSHYSAGPFIEIDTRQRGLRRNLPLVSKDNKARRCSQSAIGQGRWTKS